MSWHFANSDAASGSRDVKSPEAKRFHVWNSSRYGFDACRYDPMECWAEGETTKTQEKKSDRLLL